MATELEEEEISRALKEEDLIRPCKTCKHCKKRIGSYEKCYRDITLEFHPVTGKKAKFGEVYNCWEERWVGGSHKERSRQSCHRKGKYWEAKEDVKFWLRGWFSKK